MKPEREPHRNPIVEHLFRAADHLDGHYFTRAVTTFTSTDGQSHRAAIKQAEILDDDPSAMRVFLKSHRKEIIMTAGGLLAAAGLVQVQRNRSQRQKMGKGQSSFIRKPLSKK